MRQEQEDATRDVVEVAPGVLRMQLPISMPGLGHVNTYALVDGDGAALVDPGLPGKDSWKALVDRLRRADLRVTNVHTVLVTHSHPDHFGGASRLADEGGAKVVTHSGFRAWWLKDGHDCTDEIHDIDAEDLPHGNPWVGPTPWGGEQFRPRNERRIVARMMRPKGAHRRFAPPVADIVVRDREPLRLAGREWFVRHTPGHTLDHICLHDPEHGVLLSGDHVLPTITPHISGIGTGRNPLQAYIASLDKVAALDDVRLVLPAHGHPFGDLEARVDAIKQHHIERMEKLRSVSASLGSASVEEYSQHLFRKERWGVMAESETYAHLEHLRQSGQALRTDRDGLAYYEVAPSD